MIQLFVFLSIFAVSNSIWIGEEFWTTIHEGGIIERGRSQADFIHFKNLRDYEEVDDYVAYWIINDNRGHYEVYGEAYVEDSRVCGRFIQRGGFSDKICGGFRVLSRGKYDGANPFEWQKTSQLDRPRAVEYLDHEIARISTKQRVASIFGGIDVERGTAYGVDPNGTVINIRRNDDAPFYDEFVDVLTIRRGYEPRQDYDRQVETIRREIPKLPEPADQDSLPRIYHSDQFDQRQIVDRETWHKLHPNHRVKAFEDARGSRIHPNQNTAYDPYDLDQDGRLDDYELEARANHFKRLEEERNRLLDEENEDDQ
uniref:EF-hand domain-containing protein n=1 Tax=Panagrolaimus sp. JU765 TaxID=591449 RepID=A0AC34QG82_9BILA